MMNWSDWIAIYAAIVATVAFGWQIIAWCLGQARIEVIVFKGFHPKDTDKTTPMIFIRAINHGDKDITLHKFGLRAKDNTVSLFAGNAAKLHPRNCHTVFDLEKSHPEALNPYIAVVVDATNKHYWSKPTKID